MAVRKVDNAIYIINQHYGWDTRVMQLPVDMSMETALWLTILFTSQQRGLNSDAIDAGKALTELTSAQQAFYGVNTGEIRAWYAAMRTVKPPLVTATRTLTEAGLQVAAELVEILADGSHLDPALWQASDEFVLRGRLRWRAVGLLAILQASIDEAIATFGQEQANLHQAGDPEVLPVTRRIHTESPLLYLSGDITNYAETVRAITYLPTPTATEPNAFVPIHVLGNKGKSDTTELARLGLVDVRTVQDGARGRPKMGVCANRWGRRLIAELHQDGLLSAQL